MTQDQQWTFEFLDGINSNFKLMFRAQELRQNYDDKLKRKEMANGWLLSRQLQKGDWNRIKTHTLNVHDSSKDDIPTPRKPQQIF